MYKSERLVEFVKEKTKIKSAYMWGDYGRTITESSETVSVALSRGQTRAIEVVYRERVRGVRLRRSLQMVFVDRRRDKKRDNIQFGDG